MIDHLGFRDHFTSTSSIAMRSGPFDHRRARVAPRMDLLEELDVLALQPRDGRVEVGRAQRPVVVDLAARADQAAARPRPDRNRDVVEVDAAGRVAHEAGLRKRGPGRRRVGLGVAVAARRRRPAAPPRPCGIVAPRCVDVPLHRAARMLVVHVHVVEALGRARLRVLDHRAVRAAQIAEAALPRRLHALRAHLENLFLRRQPGQRVARHVDQLAVGRVPHLRDRQPHLAEVLVVLARVGRVPAEVPHRRLRSGQLVLRRRRDLGEEDVDVAGLHRLEPVEGRLRRRQRERLRVVRRRRRRVGRVQMDVMEVQRLDFRGRVPARAARRCQPRRRRRAMRAMNFMRIP